MAINVVGVQHNGGLLLGITLLLTHCYYHRGTHLNAMRRFCLSSQPMTPPKRFDILPPDNYPSATTRPRVAVLGETNLSTQITTDTAVA